MEAVGFRKTPNKNGDRSYFKVEALEPDWRVNTIPSQQFNTSIDCSASIARADEWQIIDF